MIPGVAQGLFPLLQHGVCTAVMDVIGGEHGDSTMAVLGVVPREERPAEGDGGRGYRRIVRGSRGGSSGFFPMSTECTAGPFVTSLFVTASGLALRLTLRGNLGRSTLLGKMSMLCSNPSCRVRPLLKRYFGHNRFALLDITRLLLPLNIKTISQSFELSPLNLCPGILPIRGLAASITGTWVLLPRILSSI